DDGLGRRRRGVNQDGRKRGKRQQMAKTEHGFLPVVSCPRGTVTARTVKHTGLLPTYSPGCDLPKLCRLITSMALRRMSASLIGHLRSSTFRLSTTAVSMSLTGSRFSSESAPRPFHYGIRGRGGTIFGSALPLHQRQVQADIRTHLIHRPARDIFPRLGGTRVFSYCDLPGPTELSAINPYAVHDHGQSARQGHNRL